LDKNQRIVAINPSNKNIYYHYFFLLLAIIGWGLSTSFVDLALPYTTPLFFLGIRFLIATIILTPFILIQRRKQLKKLLMNKWTWIVGITETIGLVFQYLGQQQGVSAGLAALLSLLFLLIVPFISPFLLNEKLKLQHLVAVFIGLIGVGFISTEGDITRLQDSSIIGILLLLGAAFGFAFYIVSTSRLRKFEMPEAETIDIFYFVLLIITLITLPMSLMVEEYYLTPEPIFYLWLAGLVLFSTLLAFFAYFVALQHISANIASILLLAQIFVPFPIDIFILGIQYSFWIFSGMFIILVAMVIAVLTPSEIKDIDLIGELVEEVLVK
jgi:drug/metabolite transporter (DMT)-like permease